MARNSFRVLVIVAVLLAVTSVISVPAWARARGSVPANNVCKACLVKVQDGVKLDMISVALAAAKGSAFSGDARSAAIKIGLAQQQLDSMRATRTDKCSQCASNTNTKPKAPRKTGPAKVVNSRCPMSENDFDPTKIEDSHIRHFYSRKVGFCSTYCAANWDKLTAAQRKVKLKAVMQFSR